jgi:hypothetical protein
MLYRSLSDVISDIIYKNVSDFIGSMDIKAFFMFLTTASSYNETAAGKE